MNSTAKYDAQRVDVRERGLVVRVLELRVVRAFLRIAVAEQAREHLLNEPRDVHRSDVFQRRDVGETCRQFARQRREFHTARERVRRIEDDCDQRELVVVRRDAAARVFGQRRQRLFHRAGPVIDETGQQRQRARRKFVVGETMRQLTRGRCERFALCRSCRSRRGARLRTRMRTRLPRCSRRGARE